MKKDFIVKSFNTPGEAHEWSKKVLGKGNYSIVDSNTLKSVVSRSVSSGRYHVVKGADFKKNLRSGKSPKIVKIPAIVKDPDAIRARGDFMRHMDEEGGPEGIDKTLLRRAEPDRLRGAVASALEGDPYGLSPEEIAGLDMSRIKSIVKSVIREMKRSGALKGAIEYENVGEDETLAARTEPGRKPKVYGTENDPLTARNRRAGEYLKSKGALKDEGKKR